MSNNHFETFTVQEKQEFTPDSSWQLVRHPSLLKLSIDNALKTQERFSAQSVIERDAQVEKETTQIFDTLTNRGISVNSISHVQSSDSWIRIKYFEEDVKREITFFIGSKNIHTATEFEQEELLSDLVQKVEGLGEVLTTMEHIFQENDTEWFKFLNEDDFLDSSKLPSELSRAGKELHGKNIIEIQTIAYDTLVSIEEKLVYFPNLDSGLRWEIQRQKIQYLSYIMGVGDTYEGGAYAFTQYEDHTEELMISIIRGFGTDKEMLDYLYTIHQAIGDNWKENDSAQASYEILTKKIRRLAFSRLKKSFEQNKPESIGEKMEPFIRLMKIATGREGSIDSKYQDASLANEVALFIMGAKGGVIDAITENTSEFYIHDPKLRGRNPSYITNSAIELLDKTGREGGSLLRQIGFSDILDIPKHTPYRRLTLQQKIKISTLARLEDEILKPENAGKELKDIFIEITQTANDVVAEGIEDNFDVGLWGKSADDYGLTGKNAELFDLFCDIHGSGLFDLADSSHEYTKAGANIAGIMAVGAGTALLCIFAAPALGAVAIGAAVGFAATAASIALSDDGYESSLEIGRNVSIELSIGTGAGALGGHIMNKLGIVKGDIWKQVSWEKIFARESFRNMWFKATKVNAGIFTVDLIALGIFTEAGRQQAMDWLFPPDTFFDNN